MTKHMKPADKQSQIDQIRNRILGNFSGSVMTLISIMVGLAMSQYLPMLNDSFLKDPAKPSWDKWLLPLITVISFLIVLFLYKWFWSFAVSVPKVSQTLTVLAIGILQSMMSLQMCNPKHWWIGFSAFLAVCIYAIHNTKTIIDEFCCNQDDRELKVLMLKGESSNQIFCAIMLCISIFTAFALDKDIDFTKYSKWNAIAGLLVITISIIMAFLTQKRYIDKIYELCGIKPKSKPRNRTGGDDEKS